MKMTQQELDTLAQLNQQRDPLQEKLTEEAERLFDLWHQLNPLSHGSRYFKSAELTEYGIRIHFEIGCSCSGHDDYDETTLPLEAILDPKWEEEARRTIAERADEKRRRIQSETEARERQQLAGLKAKYE